MLIRNKKGVALSLNTLIIAILVIIVLVVLVGFFLFGFKGLADQAKKVFFGTITGTDRTLAMQNCEQYCDQAELLKDSTVIKKVSAYCTKFFYIDDDGDGEAEYEGEGGDKKFVKFYCFPGAKTVKGGKTPAESLNVICLQEIDGESIQDICLK